MSKTDNAYESMNAAIVDYETHVCCGYENGHPVYEIRAHARSCPNVGLPHTDGCTCGLKQRIALSTEKTMHAAWRKRAEEAEAQVASLTARLAEAEAERDKFQGALECSNAAAKRRGERIADLEHVLGSLVNESSGFIGMADRKMHGDTNLAVLQMRISEARALIENVLGEADRLHSLPEGSGSGGHEMNTESIVNTDWVLVDRSTQYIGYARGFPTTNLALPAAVRYSEPCSEDTDSPAA